MNPHILMLVDHNLNPDKYTEEQLKQNAVAAYVAASYVDAAATNAAITAAAAYIAADAAANADADSAGCWVSKYFNHSGENKQDYIDEINKDNKQ